MRRAALLVVGFVTAAAAAQQQGATIDFRVGTDRGETVTDLQPSQVALKVGGRERRVRSLELVRHAAGDAPPAQALATGLPLPFAVTMVGAVAPVRHVTIVLDGSAISFGAEQPVKDGVARLLVALGPRDRVGLLSLMPGSAEIGFTTEREPILAAINRLVGGRGVPDACHTRVVLETLKGALASAPQGLSTTIFFISGGAVAASGQRGATLIGTCVRPEEYLTAEAAIDRSQASVYVVHVGIGLASGLNNLAGAIGAETALLSFGDVTALERAVTTTATYYRATFDAEPGDRSRPPQRIELRVSRQNTRVDAPKSIAFGATSSGTVGALLRATSGAADLPLRAASFPSRHTGGKVKLVTVFEPQDATASLASAIVAAFDESGEIAAQSTLRPSDLASRPLVAALPVRAGTYRVRVAATDTSDRGGTVDEMVRAELPAAATASTSGLLLGTRDGGAFAPRLQFTTEKTAVAYLEVYAGAGARVSVSFELAASAQGPARSVVPAVMQRGPGETLIATAEFDAAALAIGDTLVRAIVVVDGQPAGRVMRTLRKAGS